MVDLTIPAEITDSLAQLMLMQENLNDLAFETQEITDNAGNILKCSEFRREQLSFEIAGKALGPNSNTCKWLREYQRAALAEGDETLAEIPWKFWSKGELNLSRVRVEIVDQFHFLLSLAIVAGMDQESLVRAYKAKYAKNVERQRTGYVADCDKPVPEAAPE